MLYMYRACGSIKQEYEFTEQRSYRRSDVQLPRLAEVMPICYDLVTANSIEKSSSYQSETIPQRHTPYFESLVA